MKNEQIKIVIYGFGRMGLTHYAILNQLIEKVNFTFVDVDKRLKIFAQKNVKAQFVKDDKQLKERFDYALICTPPMYHVSIMENCLKRGDENIFVEKPFGGVNNDFSKIKEKQEKVRIGYVMRFNPIIQWVKENIAVKDVLKVRGSYFSNTIEKKPQGWRNGTFSGVSNEMGAHILDLAVYLFGLECPIIQKKSIQSIISDVDDIVDIEASENDIYYHFRFDWINKAYRKPVFNLKVTLKDGTLYKIDQQKVETFKNEKMEKSVSSVDLSQNAPFYLRGIDFTKQMEDLIGSQSTLATVDEALVTRHFIKNILT